MKPQSSIPANASVPARGARIDWATGRIIGFSVPERSSDAFEVVQLLLDGQCVFSAVANRSVFDLARDLAGFDLPSRENSAFEVKIPARSLHPGLDTDSVVHLELKTARGEPIFEHYLAGLRDLLRLTDNPPTDLLYDVRFKGVHEAALLGTVIDRHRTGLRPVLLAALNHHPAEPLPIYETSADGTVHHFSIALRPDRLVDGANSYRILAADSQPLALFPITLGVTHESAHDRRIAALEAELAFVKRAMMSQSLDALPARLSLLKSEIIGICSDMMTLQRINFEREVFGAQADVLAAPTAAAVPEAASPAGASGAAAAAAAAALAAGRKARAG